MYLPNPNNGGDFAPPPAGSHMAVCYRVVDLGTQDVNWQGQSKKQHKVLISWELPEELMEDGRPFTISQRYTFSMSDKATLRKHLEAWRGVPFQDSDFGPGGFHMSKLIGIGCLLTVMHEEKQGKTYANIVGVAKLPKSMKAPACTNSPCFLSLTDEFNTHIYEALPDWLKGIIQKSPEYQQIMQAPNARSVSQTDADPDDSVPF